MVSIGTRWGIKMRGISRISKRDSRTPRLIEGTQAPIYYFFKIYNPYYLHEKGLDRFISGNKVQFAINTPDDTIVIFDNKTPILYTGLGVWEVLSFQRMITED